MIGYIVNQILLTSDDYLIFKILINRVLGDFNVL